MELDARPTDFIGPVEPPVPADPARPALLVWLACLSYALVTAAGTGAIVLVTRRCVACQPVLPTMVVATAWLGVPAIPGLALAFAGLGPVVGEDAGRCRLTAVLGGALAAVSIIGGIGLADLDVAGACCAVPFTALAVGLVLRGLVVATGLVRTRGADACHRCGYAGHGAVAGRCPECGFLWRHPWSDAR